MRKAAVVMVLAAFFLPDSIPDTAMAEQHAEGTGKVRLIDKETKFRLYLQAAQQGDEEAQTLVGCMYMSGEGVRRDFTEAATWFRKAAEQGNEDAQYNLGGLYANGQGVTRNEAEAAKWYRRAAEQGCADAQYDLGLLYAGGTGVPQDNVLAHMFLDLASANFQASANSEMAAKERDSVASRMPVAQFLKAKRMAREWKRKKE